MSTKTISKRVALATVVALGAGVLSLVSVTSANAAAGTGLLTASTKAPTDGISAVADKDPAVATSVGVLSYSNAAGQLAQTATMLSTGAISVSETAVASTYSAIAVTGGIISAVNTATVVNSTATLAVSTGGGAFSGMGVVVKPSSGSTSLTITAYDGLSSGATSVSGGTIVGVLNVTVASSSVAGVVSPAKSGIYYANVGTAAGAGALTTDYTTAVYSNYVMGTVPSSKVQYAQVQVIDAYGNAVTSTSGLLTATATGGALVALVGGTDAATTTPTLIGSAFAVKSPATAVLTVAAPSNAPLSTTVTLAYNGVVIGTKSFTFTGDVAKLVLGAPKLVKGTGSALADTNKGATITAYDAAGNTVNLISSDPFYPRSALAASSANTSSTSTLGFEVNGTSGTSTTNYLDWSCQAGVAAHKDAVAITYTNLDGVVVTSNQITIACAGAPSTYTISYDKTSYNPGDIAVLTINFLDSKGNSAQDIATNFSDYLASNPIISVSGGTLAAVPTTTDKTSLGSISYRVLTGSTAGTFQSVVNVTTLSATGTAQTAALTIASSGTSLNDVLKGIVSLIASINKQIAALAKLVTKK